jgi:hypothetical protein
MWALACLGLMAARVEAQPLDAGEPKAELRLTLPPVHFQRQPDQPASADTAVPHRFWDGSNRWLLGFEVGALAADGWTTHYALHHDFGPALKMSEGDPLARWFVNRGWAGQIVMGTLTAGGGLLISHALHAHGHHLIERIVPVVLMSICGGAAIHNGVLIHNGLQVQPNRR